MARDKIHDAVKNVLIKDGWHITHDPYTIRYRAVRVAADLGARRAIAAAKASQQIVVEIKSFRSLSRMQDLKLAVGQYIVYAIYLHQKSLVPRLYLAVDRLIYAEYLSQPEIKLILDTIGMSLLLVDIDNEEVIEWINRDITLL